MKIEMTVDHYASTNGFSLVGAGSHEVDDKRGQYLLETFPSWFTTVEGEDEPIQNSAKKDNDGPEVTQQDSTGESAGKPLSKMNKDELTALAAEIGLEVTDEMDTNKKLAEAIKAKQEA